MKGRLALLLHAHLPFVRHPNYDRFLEEQWLFEAVVESYLPLLSYMRRWTDEGLPWRLSLTLTPTLCAMLEDSLLQHRIGRYLRERLELAESEVERWWLLAPARRAAEFYAGRFRFLLAYWVEICGRLLPEFRVYSQLGRLEILACAATHALLPPLSDRLPFLRAQAALGVAEHRRHFGADPIGIWLPECAYSPEIEPVLAEQSIRWFLLEGHGFRNGSPPPPSASFAPIITPTGMVAVARDASSAKQVWSRLGGYPGDPRYREFHRDVADDCEWNYIKGFLPGSGNRAQTGLKLHRITGASDAEKRWYDREAAMDAVRSHAGHFFEARKRQAEMVGSVLGFPPSVAMPYDAELFGHWWFEGPEFLDRLVRLGAADVEAGLEWTSPSDWVKDAGPLAHCAPATSSWGEEGHLAVWLSPENAWIQPELRALENQHRDLVTSGAQNRPGCRRILNQAMRELLLAQSSDWPFLIKMGTAADYATARVRDHVAAARKLLDAAASKSGEEDFLQSRESQYNLFPDIDLESYFL